MKKSRFSDSQIIAVLKQAEAGKPVQELCREHPICRAISRMLVCCRAKTLISTDCSKVNMGGQKAAILAQVGQVYLGAVGQFCIGVNT